MSRARSREAGFTLIELMVSLVAGLIVALAVVGLSKEATNTFHEESRTATAEMSLRTAVERLRNDLQRAGYMSSPNVVQDPLIAHAPGQPNLPDKTSFPGLAKLAGIHLTQSGSLALTTALSSLADNQSLTPDSIDLSGNFTSTEAFVVRSIDNNAGCGGKGQRLTLEMDSPAMWRIRGTPDPNATLAALFQPVAGAQFLVRVEDDTGHFQYVPTCDPGGGATAQISGVGPAMVAYVDVGSGAFQVLSAQQTQANGGATGLGVGKLLVNPVQTVHWEIRPIAPSLASDKAYVALSSDAGTATKYELFRTYVDAHGVLTNQTELITEYAVDLKFAFSADLGGPTLNGVTVPTLNPRQLTVYGLSDVRNQAIADDVNVAGTSPQRIRSVRFRLSTRAAIADRTAGLIAPAANAQQMDYPLRYCIVPTTGCTTGSEGWARVRTSTTEVALPNQARVFW